jgi:hypothetical protein
MLSLQSCPSPVLENVYWCLCGRDACFLARLSGVIRNALAAVFGGRRWEYARRLCALREAILSERGERVETLIIELGNDLAMRHADMPILAVFDEHGLWRLFHQAALYRSTRRSSLTFDWEIRYAALLFMRDWRHCVKAFGECLLHVRDEGSRKLAAVHRSTAVTVLASGHLGDCMRDLQCGVAVISGDVAWLTTETPERRRPCNFFPLAAPGTPRVRSDSEDWSSTEL